ncbi:hypothetical protein ACFLZW_06740 [Chloroflexota bacterium]
MNFIKSSLAKMILVISIMVLLTGTHCSSTENIYRYESKCPIDLGAKNLVIIHKRGVLTVAGFNDQGDLELDKSISFYQEKEIGFTKISLEGYSDIVAEETVLDPNWGVIVNKGYFQIGADGILPAQTPASEVPVGMPEGLYRACPDAYGSENIIILRGGDNSSSKFAGLWWLNKEVVANVWEDGTVEVTGLGISAIDINENKWVSKRIGGKVDAFVMVKDD